MPIIDDVKLALDYIEALKNASLDSDIEPTSEELRSQIRNPPQHILTIDNPNDRLSLDIFLAIGNASEHSYDSIRTAIHRCYPESELLSYYKVKRLVAELSGVSPVERDMCINSCIGYTGPLAAAETCTHCGEPRYDPANNKKIPRKQFTTIPLAPQLQALWRTPQGAISMGYRERCTKNILDELQRQDGVRTSPYRDFFDGADYLEAVRDGRISTDDMVLMLSIDGAQLYRNKVSECWIYIWIIFDHAPSVRYKKKHILPGGFIPGPGKPKNPDSFIFTGLHHIAAIQKEGLRIWDAARDRVFTSYPFLALATADGPGMACLSGFVGHQGKCHCRVHCGLKGRHKPGKPQYYPVRKKPHNYNVQGCDHDDVDLNDLLGNFTTEESEARYKENLQTVQMSPNQADYYKARLESGICKPTIFSGLPPERILGVPGCFPLDVMHLPALNLPDLFIKLWRGTFDCDPTDSKANWSWFVLKGQTWKDHGKMVADATSYIPGSFDRPPRNPAEKINSGYKAWEFLLYFYGLGPCLFYTVLPDIYWRHYCKLVRGINILLQEEISTEELQEAHEKLTQFSDEFEELYYQRRADRIHFVRPSIHAPSHLPPETERIGPGIIFSQWGIERTIGNLGEEITSHVNPFANIAQRGVRRCQVNALKAMIPDLEPEINQLPRGARDLGDGYVLLTAVDSIGRPVRDCEAEAIRNYIVDAGGHVPAGRPVYVKRWARVRLPNGQVARTLWKESSKPPNRCRTSRNVKVSYSSRFFGHPLT